MSLENNIHICICSSDTLFATLSYAASIDMQVSGGLVMRVREEYFKYVSFCFFLNKPVLRAYLASPVCSLCIPNLKIHQGMVAYTTIFCKPDAVKRHIFNGINITANELTIKVQYLKCTTSLRQKYYKKIFCNWSRISAIFLPLNS